jgi:putative membrane protein
MGGLIIRFVVSALALGVTTYLVPGMHSYSVPALLVAALILGILNAIIRPILFLLTLPINLLTLGLFTFIINAAMLKVTSLLVKGFAIDNFVAAILGAVVLAIVSALLNWLVKDARERRREED